MTQTATKTPIAKTSKKNSYLDWTTVGVDKNIIEASWKALLEAIEYKLSHTSLRGARH